MTKKEPTFYIVSYSTFCIDGGGIGGGVYMYETYEDARKAFNQEIFYENAENLEELYAPEFHDFANENYLFEVDLDPSEPKTNIGRIERITFSVPDPQTEIDNFVEENGLPEFTG
jgi:hypothetical protein